MSYDEPAEEAPKIAKTLMELSLKKRRKVLRKAMKKSKIKKNM